MNTGTVHCILLLHMIMVAARPKMQLCNNDDDGLPDSISSSIPSDPSQWSLQYDKLMAQQLQQQSSLSSSPPLLQQARDALHHHRADGGVLDMAGGSGHMSLVLSLLGVCSTVVDPRDKVGRLPKHDCKVYHRALRQQQQPSKGESNNNAAWMNCADALPETTTMPSSPLLTRNGGRSMGIPR